jgi:endonuclease YncB( thermonuclease family)
MDGRPRLIGVAAMGLAVSLLTASAAAETFSGRVVGVTDGNTTTVRRDGQPVRVRLEGIASGGVPPSRALV